jgi:iron complex outermembrane receptor protein
LFSAQNLQTETGLPSKSACLSLGMIVLGACMVVPSTSFAKSKPKDLAAEVARLQKELGESKKENQQLKNALQNSNTPTTATATAPVAVEAVAQPVVAAETVASVAKVEKPAVEEPRNLSEVVVTARRKEERLQDVPVPITVLTAKNIERDRTFDVQDLTKRAPDLQATTPNGRRTGISLRGIGKASGNDGMEAAVGVMVDDVFMGGNVGMSYQDFTDVERIEVLRGPQGTLMGKNTTMGLINYTMKSALFKQQGMIEGETGGNQQTGVMPTAFKARASYTNGIVDNKLAFRGSMFINKQAGDIHNINYLLNDSINERNRYGGRLQFLYTPTEKIKFRLNMDYAYSNEYSNVQPSMEDPIAFANGAIRPITYSSRLARSYFGGYRPIIGTDAWNMIDAGQIQRLPTTNGGVSGKLDWNLGNVGTFSSILAYREFHFDAHNDSDQTKFAISVGGTKVDSKQYSFENRLASNPFKWLDNQGGLFMMHYETNSLSRSLYGQDAGAFYATDAQYRTLNTAANRQFLVSSLNNVYSTTKLTPATDSIALFDQANIHFNEKATLTLGIRQTYESKTSSITKSATYGDGSALTSTGNATANAIRQAQINNTYPQQPGQTIGEWTTSWTASPSYKLNKDIMLYASGAGGAKSGSVQFNSSTGAPLNVKPEETLDAELGIKSTLLDKKVILNVNLFLTEVTNYQATTSVVDPTTATGYRSQLGNIPGIEAMGVEIDSAWYPTSYLTLSFGGAYNHAVYSSWNTATCPVEQNSTGVCNNTGKQISAAPLYTGIFGADVHKPISDLLSAHGWVNTIVRSTQNLDSLLSLYGVQKTYQVTDLGIGLLTGKKVKYELDLVANNVFDTKYTTSVTSYSNTGAVGFDGLGQRRYVGLVLRSNF